MEVTWVGHATTLIDVDGYRVLTDPLMTKRVAHLRRRRPEPAPETFDVDLVLLSHVHVDHLHLPSLKRLRPTARVITPNGSAKLLRRAGFADVTEIVVGDRIDSGPVTVEVVPAVHKRGRGPHSRISADPVGIHRQRCRPSGLLPRRHRPLRRDGRLRRHRCGPAADLGLGVHPRRGPSEPQRAATATSRIEPGLLVPIHWGTYAPEDGRRRLPRWFDTPPTELRTELDAIDELHRLGLVEPGESFTVTSR